MEDPNTPPQQNTPPVSSRPLRPTQSSEPTPAGVSADALLADAERRRKLEQDLARMGMSPEEVRRLLNAPSDTTSPLRGAVNGLPPLNPSLSAMPAPGGKQPAANPASMSSYAADLMAKRAAELQQTVAMAEANFPPFREASGQEVRQAETLLRDAAMLKRREKFKEAEQKCREALNLTPKDSAALELLGDVMQGVARVAESLAAYKRAVEADPKRSSAERKYGELLMQQQQWGGPDPEAVPKNPWLALLLSLLLPSFGQFYNGEIGKGLFFLLADAVCFYLLAFSPYGFAHQQVHHGIGAGLITCVIVTVVIYIAGAIDAHFGAKQGRMRGSGWEV